MHAFIEAATDYAGTYITKLDDYNLVLKSGSYTISVLLQAHPDDRSGLVRPATNYSAEVAIKDGDEYINASDYRVEHWNIEQFCGLMATLHDPSIRSFKKAWQDGKEEW